MTRSSNQGDALTDTKQLNGSALTRRLKTMAAADIRSLLPGEPDGPANADVAERPGCPDRSTIARWRTGERASPYQYLYCLLAALHDMDVPDSHLRQPELALQSARSVIQSEPAGVGELKRQFRDAALRADVTEQQAQSSKRDLYLEGFSLPAIRRHLPVMEKQVTETQHRIRLCRQLLTAAELDG